MTAPTYPLLAGRARRFTSLVTQMHMEVLGALPVEPRAGCGVRDVPRRDPDRGEVDRRLSANALVSGARFALSVHNSPSGVYSVATGSTSPTTTVTGANAIAAGWLEAALTAHDRPVLLSIADEPVPAVFHGPTRARRRRRRRSCSAPTGRPAELVMATGEPDESDRPLQTLARIADACARDAATVIALGSVQPGTTLELHVDGTDDRGFVRSRTTCRIARRCC